MHDELFLELVLASNRDSRVCKIMRVWSHHPEAYKGNFFQARAKKPTLLYVLLSFDTPLKPKHLILLLLYI